MFLRRAGIYKLTTNKSEQQIMQIFSTNGLMLSMAYSKLRSIKIDNIKYED